MRHFIEPTRGYCPYLGRTHTIYIEYAELLLAGGQPLKKQKVGYDCDSRDECQREYKKACPIVKDEENNG